MTRYLVSASQYLAIAHVDVANATLVDLQILHRGHGLYTGVSWDRRTIYAVGTNGRRWGDGDTSREKIYVLGDLPTCATLGTCDTHQVHWDDARGQLLVCDTGHDQLLAWSPGDARPSGFYPLPEQGVVYRPPANRHHLNSVWVDREGTIWIVVRFAYPEKRSEVWRRGSATWVPHAEVEYESHNVCIKDRVLHTVGSIDHVLVSRLGGTLAEVELPRGYPRGLAVTDTWVVIGQGPRGAHDARHKYNGRLIFVRDGRIHHIVGLPKSGQVYTVRALDEIDWAHQGDWGPAFPHVDW